MADASSVSGDRDQRPAISRSNLIEKLCFVRYGAGFEAHRAKLEGDLQAFVRGGGSHSVSRPAISSWFTRRSKPGRRSAFEFLLTYVDGEIPYETLNPDQKKVYTQIRSFLSASIASIERGAEAGDKKYRLPRPVSLQIKGTSISPELGTRQAKNFFGTWPGTYLAYRQRLIDDNGPWIAREVVRLTRFKDQIAYEHWHWKNGAEVAKFEGFLHLRGESVWLLGQSDDESRLRICHLPRGDVDNPRYSKFRWGLMHSDIPLPTSKDPASTRILLIKLDARPLEMDRFVSEMVKYVDEKCSPEIENEWILRFLTNRVSSHSKHNSIDPEDDRDNILRVERRTLERACNTVEFNI